MRPRPLIHSVFPSLTQLSYPSSQPSIRPSMMSALQHRHRRRLNLACKLSAVCREQFGTEGECERHNNTHMLLYFAYSCIVFYLIYCCTYFDDNLCGPRTCCTRMGNGMKAQLTDGPTNGPTNGPVWARGIKVLQI